MEKHPFTFAPSDTTTCTATGLATGNTPQFYVTATNASGESAASNAVAPTTVTGTERRWQR